MQRPVQPWRDPTFFAFALFGVVLLCTGVLCQAKARNAGPETGPLVTHTRQLDQRLPKSTLPDPDDYKPSLFERQTLHKALTY